MCEAKGYPINSDEAAELCSQPKEAITAHIQGLPGKTILTPEQFETIRSISARVQEHPEAGDLIKEGLPEVTFRSAPLKLGYRVQCRFDWLNVNGCVHSEGRPYGFDLKTVSSLSRWNREFLNRGYYRSWPFYAKTQEISLGEAIIRDWFFVVAEKEWPHSVMVVRPSVECYDRGMAETTKDMQALADCIRNNHYPDPGDGGITMQQLPDWMLNDNVPSPGIHTGPEYVPHRNYEYEEGWERETNTAPAPPC